jgi:hypothetical protein
MWNNKIPEIISERPEEEERESYKQDDASQHVLKKPNKINKILDSCKTQNSDYNSLFKEKKLNSLQNKPSSIAIEEDTVQYINHNKNTQLEDLDLDIEIKIESDAINKFNSSGVPDTKIKIEEVEKPMYSIII